LKAKACNFHADCKSHNLLGNPLTSQAIWVQVDKCVPPSHCQSITQKQKCFECQPRGGGGGVTC